MADVKCFAGSFPPLIGDTLGHASPRSPCGDVLLTALVRGTLTYQGIGSY